MFIFLMQFMLKYITKIFGKGLGVITILELVFYNLAWMFALAVPMAVLVSTLMSFGRLSGDNEITILKSSGISIYRIIRPALIYASCITLFMIMFNDKILPDFNHKARIMFRNIGQKKATLKLEPGIFFTFSKFSFYVEKIEKSLGEELSNRTNILGPEFQTETKPDKLINVSIFDYSKTTKTITVTGKEGYMVYSKSKKSLVFTLFDGEYHESDNINSDDYRFSFFRKNTFYIPAPEFELENRGDEYRGDREMNVSMMMEKVNGNRNSLVAEREKITSQMEKHWRPIEQNTRTFKNFTPVEDLNNKNNYTGGDSLLFASVNRALLTKAVERAHRKLSRLYQKLRVSGSRISSHEESINKYLVEVHKKFSIPFASIVFILVGAPLGIASRKGSLGVGATLSIFFFLVYWACLILGEDLADRRLLPPLVAMWFPNILIGAAGFYLTWRTVKEKTFINWDKLISKFRKNKTTTDIQ
jgi:lipopolysaccharide export system permease protein